MAVASSTSETAVDRIGDGDRRRPREPGELDREVPDEARHHEREEQADEDPARDRDPLARCGDGPRDDDRGLGAGRLSALTPPPLEDLVRVQAEVERVVAQEALGVDRPGQVPPLAVLASPAS